ncbi:MAG: hypothetical protein D6725_01930 [Planctomycetota bacterium]|nr:MAG: hypothetical protein D6725_01930 [Planctomycetota bacterium]
MVKKKRVVAKSAATKAGTKKKAKKAAKKKAAKKAARRVTARAREPRRLVWIVCSSSMREQARFPYEKREEAEELLKRLQEKWKGKRRYYLQPYKEPLSAAGASTPLSATEEQQTESDEEAKSAESAEAEEAEEE